ncbi:2-hydroxychromene-2-carboxylate isomerase [Chondromyces apiculatus]|uniref:2-hydroxychromene-2-carboxylate isomerase n=1 Tax=Chondromyces apiculatus DSM 436 TaxID=1192034 RepID=A0A017TCY1_9BACT|nr:2-hydroxychromene-2-carboxylate isomerase [Chondromyces apiculatus]EYF06787.1 2-hydroxychromene-2-carboxylate isomerase family protein [Chondromyces apiculatus DSM 436]
MRGAPVTIRFFFDVISPYAYLGWTQIHALAERTGAVVVPEAVLFAAMLNHHGNKGPAEIAPKRIYLFKDVLRRAHRLGVPFAAPPHHPFNPLTAMRVASLPLPEESRRRLIDGLFAAVWGGGEGLESPEAVARVATAVGLDGAALVAEAQTAEAKARLRERSDAAIQQGVFGVPTMVVGDELFWGADALVEVEAYLRGEDPLQQEGGAAALSRWVETTPSARRTPG